MEHKQLCLQLVACESEREVEETLEAANLWHDPFAWAYFGGNENNFATIGNQQSRAESALVEKLINSVDAVLMDECLKRRIDPESDEAPPNTRDALQRFFGIAEGRLTGMPATQRSQLAERICLVASGARSRSNYAIIDSGEGQSPKRMPETLLSLGRSNKLRIPFVQGKFNMGGTGVFQFCGDKNLQLIISKRDPVIADNETDGTKRRWGFTIIRRENPTHGAKHSVYKYLAPGGDVLSFEAEELPLLPTDYPNPHGAPMRWGTFIKLFEYHLPGLRTNILFDLYNRLSLLMAEVALPIRLIERRSGYRGHSFETTLAGLSTRLDEDRRDNLEEGFPSSSMISAAGQALRVSIYAFKREQATKYRKEEGIVFIVNGQTHGHIPTTFFSRQAVGMAYLADSLLLVVDCTSIDGRAREDLFMNSRDRLRAGELKSVIEREIEDLLKTHPGLRDLRERRRREDTEKRLEDQRPLEEIVQRVLRDAPSLANLFRLGGRVQNPFRTDPSDESPKPYVGRRFPDYFTIAEKYSETRPKRCHINNKRFRIEYLTNAANDYFTARVEPVIRPFILPHGDRFWDTEALQVSG